MADKKRKYKTSDIDVRVALWETYNHLNAYAKDDLLDFREMEIDHIIPQDIFKNPIEMKKLLDEFGLPKDFEKDSLKNYTPTRKSQNNGKSNKTSGNLVKAQMANALREASEKEKLILKKIEEYNLSRDVIASAANIAVNVHDDKQKYSVIDIILNEVDDFEIRENVLNSQYTKFENETYIKSTSKISIIGYLPNMKNITPCCYLNFRTLKLRNCTVRVDGNEILRSLCWGIDTHIRDNIKQYISKNIDGTNNVVFGGCSFTLNGSDAEELSEVIDFYCKKYLQKLVMCENKYDLKKFKCTDNGNIKLFRLRQSICVCVFKFIENNKDYDNLHIEWNANMIRISSQNERLHAIIMLSQGKFYNWFNEPDFWFELLPYYVTNSAYLDREEWWSPSRVSDWFMDSLLPNAIRYNNVNRKSFFKWHNKDKNIDTIISSIRNEILTFSFTDKKTININEIQDEKTILCAVNELQQFYNIKHGKYLYIWGKRLGIYEALIILLKMAKLPEYSYKFISSKLDFSTQPTAEMLLREIKMHAEELKTKSKVSFLEIEYAFRCIGECIERNLVELSYATILEIKNLLEYTISTYNTHVLIEKYSGIK